MCYNIFLVILHQIKNMMKPNNLTKLFLQTVTLLCLLQFCVLRSQGQSFMPIISNYNSFAYHFGMQNWSCAQDAQGIMYFGNNNGMLSFDGYEWQSAAMPSKGIVRSILADGDRIYVGSYTDFGYFLRTDTGGMVYHSLWPKGYHSHNDEIWKIVKAANGHIYFQSFCSYFEYDGHTVTPYYNSNRLPLWFFDLYGKVYAQMVNGDLCLVSGKRYPPILDRRAFGNDDIVGMHQFGGKKILLVTNKKGIYLYDEKNVSLVHVEADALLRHSLVNRTVMLDGSTLVLGTIKNGIFAINLMTGKTLWHYHKGNGLANNTVLSLYVDKESNLWAALDNGIALIHTGLPLSVMRLDGVGMVYGMTVKGSDMYIGTNQSVWRYDMLQQCITVVPGTEGQNWYIDQFDGQVLAGNNLGIKHIMGNKANSMFSEVRGSTVVKEYRLFGQQALLEATYNGFRLYRFVSGNWHFAHEIKGFSAPVREFEIDNQGVVWATHMSKGLYRLELSKDMSRFVQVKYYPSLRKGPGEMFHVMNIAGRVVFSYSGRLYTYDDIRKRIMPYEGCGQLGHMGIVTSAFVDKNTFWVLNKDGYWLMQLENKGTIPMTFTSASVFGQECNIYGQSIYVAGGNTYFFLNDGVGRYEGRRGKKSLAKYELSFSEVTTKDRENAPQRLPIKGDADVKALGNIFFKVSYPNFDNEKLLFTYVLKGGGKTLTETTTMPVVAYSSLSYGDYELTVKVKSLKGDTLCAPIHYNFSYSTPFWLSIWAWSIYLLLLYGCVYAYIRWRTNKIVRRNQKKAEAELVKQRMKSLEQERIIAEQQKKLLENELALKGKDVASMAFDMVAMKNSINGVKESLLEGVRKGTISSKNINKILLQMKDSDDNLFWSTFQNNFDLIHKKFFRNLHERFPDLTANDLKICALLRLNLNTKEIANFTHLTIRGVEGARYRLRKKLGIPTDKSLTDFLIEFE